MFTKVSDIHFRLNGSVKWLPKKQIFSLTEEWVNNEDESLVPSFQVIGRTTIPFLRTIFVPAGKRIGADMLEFTVLEIADVFSG